MTGSEAFEALGLGPDASPADVRRAYLERAKALHPDAGGDAEVFARLVEARDVATAAAMSAPCPACDGTGASRVGRGFAGVSKVCAACGGSRKRHAPWAT